MPANIQMKNLGVRKYIYIYIFYKRAQISTLQKKSDGNLKITDLPDWQFHRATVGHSSRNLWSSLA